MFKIYRLYVYIPYNQKNYKGKPHWPMCLSLNEYITGDWYSLLFNFAIVLDFLHQTYFIKVMDTKKFQFLKFQNENERVKY